MPLEYARNVREALFSHLPGSTTLLDLRDSPIPGFRRSLRVELVSTGDVSPKLREELEAVHAAYVRREPAQKGFKPTRLVWETGGKAFCLAGSPSRLRALEAAFKKVFERRERARI